MLKCLEEENRASVHINLIGTDYDSELLIIIAIIKYGACL